jgi:hypothetical protein
MGQVHHGSATTTSEVPTSLPQPPATSVPIRSKWTPASSQLAEHDREVQGNREEDPTVPGRRCAHDSERFCIIA